MTGIHVQDEQAVRAGTSDLRRPLAVITGASGGIGEALALRFAHAGFSLLLAGRDVARLKAVAEQVRAVGVLAELRCVDLSDASALEQFAGEIEALTPDILVNNAGFGGFGPFMHTDPQLVAGMISTNISALTRLTRAVLPGMVARDSGRILQVASTGAFAPLPYSAAYGATKAYVLSFSEAVAEELHGTSVSVTVLCPGPTATPFFERAGWDGTRLFKGGMSTPQDVATQGYAGLMAGRRVVVVGWRNRLMVAAIRFAPRRLVSLATRIMLASR